MEKAEDQSAYDGLAKKWHEALKLSGKRQKAWEKQGQQVVDRYRDKRSPDDNSKRFNVLWSNVETLRPSLYSQQPKPQVTRRYKDKDPLGRATATVLERALEYGVDTYDFDDVMLACVEDYLLPGRGVARVRYIPTFGQPQGEGEEAYRPLESEEAVCEYVFWKDVRFSPGRRWEEVSWVAFRSFLTKEDYKARFPGKEFKADYKADDAEEDAAEQFKKAVVWEIWDKSNKKVIWLAESDPDSVLEVRSPHLNLKGFFPCPKPLFSLVTNDDLTPVPDYVEYQDQADELDSLSGRIEALTKALKVVGVYAGESGEISRMLNEGTDNQLIPVDNWTMFAERGGIKGMIDWFPVEQVGNVLIGLYEARERTKQELYEITGLSDLIRGASDPKDTATAQRIKGQFATQRLGERQYRVAVFARDLLRLKAEVIAEQFSKETLQSMTGIELAENVWDQIIALLRNDPLRTYRIDIETETTVKVDDDAERASRLEFVTTIGQFLEGAVPFVRDSPELAPLASEMLLFAIRGFKVGRQLEGAFEEAVEQMSGKKDSPETDQARQIIQQLQQQIEELTQGREAEMFQIEKAAKVTDIESKRTEVQIRQTEAAASIQLKRAQALKASEEARAQDIENDAVESGVGELMDAGEMGRLENKRDGLVREIAELQAPPKPDGPKIIKIIRTQDGLEGEITGDHGVRRVVVTRTSEGMEGYVEGEDAEAV